MNLDIEAVGKSLRLKQIGRLLMSLVFATSMILQTTVARSQSRGVAAIRDSEIEALIRDYAVPIFKAARVNSSAVSIYIVNDRSFNAFVAGGRRLFINAGALMTTATPNEIIGVIAHETGHIAGGHLARQREALRRAQTASIIAMILGAGAIAAGGGEAGSAVISGGQNAALRSFLKYQRAEESAADRAAIRYLNTTGQSARGMLTTFERFADQQLFSSRNIDPYFQSHPMARDRITSLQNLAEQSPYFNRLDPEDLQFRHDLMRAKLSGFLEHKDTVSRRYPRSDTSIPARYARAIALFLHDDVRKAVRKIDKLIKEMPDYPYFWELKGQALLESGRPKEAIQPLKRAVALAPNADLIRMMLGKAYLATEQPQYLDAAITELRRALAREPEASGGLRQLAIAYGRKGDIARAELATSRAYFAEGDLNQAKQHAARVQKRVGRGSPLWLQADDIINFRAPEQ